MSNPRRRYFAYGSNMHAVQMARRCPAALRGEVVTMPGWRFVINRRGVATLVPNAKSEAVGLVWHLSEACEKALDRYEGVKLGHYRKQVMPIAGESTLVYLAADERPGSPRPGYLEGILEAAASLALATNYCTDLAAWSKAVAPWLVAEVLAGYRLAPGGIHGPGHWLRVHTNGLMLAGMTPGADAAIIELFALLHDSQRHDEGKDRGHGERASTYVRRLASDGLLRLEAARVDLLATACASHEHGQVTEDPTIGCCWDADRLELSRLGRRPIAQLLSTKAAREASIQLAAWERGSSWAIEPASATTWGLDPTLLVSDTAA